MAFWAAAHWVVQYSLETNALQAVPQQEQFSGEMPQAFPEQNRNKT